MVKKVITQNTKVIFPASFKVSFIIQSILSINKFPLAYIPYEGVRRDFLV